MSSVYTTEITSDKILSDNPIHQRLFKAYIIAQEHVSGNVLEVGCGEGRGIDLLLPRLEHFTAIDKLEGTLKNLQEQFPSVSFQSMIIPPMPLLPSNQYDSIISFQVIEHIQDDSLFLKEIHRMLKPGGTALITTPNRSMSLSRNPWHIREYLPAELRALAMKYFTHVEVKGITGDEKVMRYYEENRQSVRRYTQWDIFDLQHRLPAFLLRLPYEILNRWNRNRLQEKRNDLVENISHENYVVTEDPDNALDLLLIVRK